MNQPKTSRKAPARTDVRFDFVDKLPPGVPPIEQQPTSLFPFPPPVGPADATYYFPVPLPACNPTGVFFPSGYGYPDKINVILYFHGHKLGEFNHIHEYWHGNLHNIRLREDINASGKKVVLIAPTMGPRPGSSLNKDMGIFRQPAGADDFLLEVAKWIGKYVPRYVAKKVTPTFGNIVLAGHSGAGGILLQQAKTMRSRVCEVWGFDSMYGQGTTKVGGREVPIDVPGEWRDAAARQHEFEFDLFAGVLPVPRLRPTTRFFFYWAGSSPGRNSKALQKIVTERGLTNVTVEQNAHVGSRFHFETLTVHFKKRVAAAGCF